MKALIEWHRKEIGPTDIPTWQFASNVREKLGVQIPNAPPEVFAGEALDIIDNRKRDS